MRVTIIADDSTVYVEEQPLKVDVTDLHPYISVIQWYGTVGEIEFHTDFVLNKKLPNLRFTDFSPFQMFVDRWTVEAQKSEPAPAPMVRPPSPATGTTSVVE